MSFGVHPGLRVFHQATLSSKDEESQTYRRITSDYLLLGFASSLYDEVGAPQMEIETKIETLSAWPSVGVRPMSLATVV